MNIPFACEYPSHYPSIQILMIIYVVTCNNNMRINEWIFGWIDIFIWLDRYIVEWVDR